MTENELILHGTFLSIYGLGTFITGEPGIGKSELALSLISKGHQLIADDAPIFYRDENRIMGQSQLERPYLSVRGIGLIDIEQVFGCNSSTKKHELKFIIKLIKAKKTHAITHLEGQTSMEGLLGCLIPCRVIPISNARNLEVLVTTLVKVEINAINGLTDSFTSMQAELRLKMESLS